MKKIEQMTADQESQIPVYLKKYLNFGTEIKKTNREKVTKDIKEYYRLNNLTEPTVIFTESPYKANLFINLLKEHTFYLEDDIQQKLESLYIGNLPVKNKFEYTSTWFWGCFDNYIIGYYRFIEEVLEVKLNDITQQKFDLFDNISQELSFWYPYENICIVSERHTMLNRDEQGRLHNLNGAAIQFADGWSVYAVHGVIVPEFVILEKEKITAKLIDKESNIEVRRIMLNIFGPEKYLLDGEYEVLDTDKDQFGRPRRLLRGKNGEDEEIIRVEVINSSKEINLALDQLKNMSHYYRNMSKEVFKKYYLPVHPELKPMKNGALIPNAKAQKMTCHNAVASTFGYYGKDYFPAKES